MKLTVREVRSIIGYLEVAQSTTERGLRDSNEGSAYHSIMSRQLEGIKDLIKKLNDTEV